MPQRRRRLDFRGFHLSRLRARPYGAPCLAQRPQQGLHFGQRSIFLFDVCRQQPEAHVLVKVRQIPADRTAGLPIESSVELVDSCDRLPNRLPACPNISCSQVVARIADHSQCVFVKDMNQLERIGRAKSYCRDMRLST